MAEYLVTDKEGRRVARGDTVWDFRGKSTTFDHVTRGPVEGKSAKVLIKADDSDYGREYYAGVFDLTVEEVS